MPKCPFCSKYFGLKQPTLEHINKCHPDQLTEMDAAQALYYSTHGTIKGSCMCGCSRPTEWNFKTGKPFKVSTDPKCKARIAAQADARNISVYGKPKLLDDMSRQKSMLKKRHIAGDYAFSDGGVIGYVAKLEKNFLWFCDTILEFTSNMILDADQHGIEIKYLDKKENVTRTYIPDFYLPDYNALIEIKSSNSNPAYIKETKYKEQYKDDAVKAQKKYNYIKIIDAKYGPYIEFLANIVRAGRDNISSKSAPDNVYVITESACCYNDDIPMNEVAFPGLHVAVARDPYFHKVRAIAVTESSLFGKIYLSDEEGLRETTMHDPDLDDDEVDLYRYAGAKADSDKILRSVINVAESVGTQSGINQVCNILGDYGVNYHFDEAISTNNAMSDFIKIGTLSPRNGGEAE